MKKRILFFLACLILALMIGCQQSGKATRTLYYPQQSQYDQYPTTAQEQYYYEKDIASQYPTNAQGQYEGDVSSQYPASVNEGEYYGRDAVYSVPDRASLVYMNKRNLKDEAMFYNLISEFSNKFRDVFYLNEEELIKLFERLHKEITGSKTEVTKKIEEKLNGKVICHTDTYKHNETTFKSTTTCYYVNTDICVLKVVTEKKIIDNTIETESYYYREPCELNDFYKREKEIVIKQKSVRTISYNKENLEVSEENIDIQSKKTTITEYCYNSTGGYTGENITSYKVDKNVNNCDKKIIKTVKRNAQGKINEETFTTKKCTGIKPNCKCDECEKIEVITYTPYNKEFHGETFVKDNARKISTKSPCAGAAAVVNYIYNNKAWEVKP
jgi:hypothetical protein